MGMCGEEFPWGVEALREVPGGQHFSTAHKIGTSRSQNAQPERAVINLSDLCRNNGDAPIKFALRNLTTGGIFSECTTTLNQLNSNPTLNDNTTAYAFNNVSVYTRPTFLDYLRSGW